MSFPWLWLQHTQTGDKGAAAKLIRALSKASIRNLKSLRRGDTRGPAGGRRDEHEGLRWWEHLTNTHVPCKQEPAMQTPSQIVDIVCSAVTLLS